MIRLAKQNETSESAWGLFGQISVCLRNHTPAELQLVSRQLRIPSVGLTGEPDVVIRFEDRVELPALRHADDSTGFSDDGFFVLRGRRGERVRVRLPVEDLGTGCELVCQRGLSAIPMLDSIVKVAALSRGILPLHASSFVFRGQGALVTGFAHSAKTTTLMGFMGHGAQCIGDDTAYLGRDGRLAGEKSPIGLSDRHLADLPETRPAIPYRQRLAISTARALSKSISAVVPGYECGQSTLHRGLRKLDQALSSRCCVELAPDKLFGAEALCDGHNLQRAFLSLAHDSEDIVIEDVAREAFIGQLVHVIRREFDELMSLYEKFRFAFPRRRNALLDGLSQRITEVARERVGRQAFYTVCHPYPVSPQAMFAALSPLF